MSTYELFVRTTRKARNLAVPYRCTGKKHCRSPTLPEPLRGWGMKGVTLMAYYHLTIKKDTKPDGSKIIATNKVRKQKNMAS